MVYQSELDTQIPSALNPIQQGLKLVLFSLPVGCSPPQRLIQYNKD